MRFLDWLNDLGEKSSRTDIWVILITLTYLGCIFNFISCEETPITSTILIAMFADLGISTITKTYKNLKQDDSNK